VNVPERYAPSTRPGTAAHLILAEYPGRDFRDQVVRSAEAIEAATRTLLTEVNVANKEGELLPGGYAQVHLQVQMAMPRLLVPVNALLFRSEGLRVVVVDSGADGGTGLRRHARDPRRARARAVDRGEPGGLPRRGAAGAPGPGGSARAGS
jgi:multidrug efflux pump subunit AcrA (membrane-fusion protein)